MPPLATASPLITADRRWAAWLSDPSFAAAEICRGIGYGAVVLDIEHGSFDLADLERFIPFLKALGMDVLAKALGPERGPIQQALDFGANAVVIPHVESLDHAKEVTAFAKFPTKGNRSFAGGRTARYSGFDDRWVSDQDAGTRCYPMIEDAGALEDVESILALPTVDGVFVGPSDLSLSRARGAYSREAGDFEDLKRVAEAASAAGKRWVLPAWSREEKEFALRNGADQLVLTMEHGALVAGFSAAFNEMSSIEASVTAGEAR